ncbi:MAG: hypothetical protein JWN43_4836 [Gammaproteobacteria bacterium]|nr:hypothetical protein [Gammaproteobacteria bacterium]
MRRPNALLSATAIHVSFPLGPGIDRMGHQEQKHGSPRDDQLLRRHASRLDHSWRVYDHPYTITRIRSPRSNLSPDAARLLVAIPIAVFMIIDARPAS